MLIGFFIIFNSCIVFLPKLTVNKPLFYRVTDENEISSLLIKWKDSIGFKI